MKCKQLTIKHHSYVRFYYLFYCYVVLYKKLLMTFSIVISSRRKNTKEKHRFLRIL